MSYKSKLILHIGKQIQRIAPDNLGIVTIYKLAVAYVDDCLGLLNAVFGYRFPNDEAQCRRILQLLEQWGCNENFLKGDYMVNLRVHSNDGCRLVADR